MELSPTVRSGGGEAQVILEKARVILEPKVQFISTKITLPAEMIGISESKSTHSPAQLPGTSRNIEYPVRIILISRRERDKRSRHISAIARPKEMRTVVCREQTDFDERVDEWLFLKVRMAMMLHDPVRDTHSDTDSFGDHYKREAVMTTWISTNARWSLGRKGDRVHGTRMVQWSGGRHQVLTEFQLDEWACTSKILREVLLRYCKVECTHFRGIITVYGA
ncbi:hypothetical protein C8R45DRAFT_941192 [Mycena sanguinolenta]|nr:hypothetical protein C8R45DRAFT_941192 [Mycena sanguinolenta]